MGPARRLVGLEEAAAVLGISIWTVREMVYRRDLRVVKLPRVRRFLLDLRDLEALIAAGKDE
jgi:excisionase family DNA binding protein